VDIVIEVFQLELEKNQSLFLALPGHGVNLEFDGFVVAKALHNKFGYFLNQDSKSTTVRIVSLLIRIAQKYQSLQRLDPVNLYLSF
jgi:hypothetical protein